MSDGYSIRVKRDDLTPGLKAKLRALEERGDYESPALEAALLEGVRNPHRTYGPATLNRVRKAARKK